MKFYQEITLLPDTEISLYFIWQKVYQQLHIALVENKDNEDNSKIALSFPKYNESKTHLGDKLRIFAETEDQLKQFNTSHWLERFSDYIHITSIRSVPEKVKGYACFFRKRVKSNILRLARRRAKWKNETLDEALKHLSKPKKNINTNLPYIQVTSVTNKEKFRLFINQQVFSEPAIGHLSCYGLSRGVQEHRTTVPWF